MQGHIYNVIIFRFHQNYWWWSNVSITKEILESAPDTMKKIIYHLPNMFEKILLSVEKIRILEISYRINTEL